ncbi:hypothetical protein AAZX31_13G219300 [Glycine max]
MMEVLVLGCTGVAFSMLSPNNTLLSTLSLSLSVSWGSLCGRVES